MAQQTFKMIRDKNNPKFRINECLVRSTKHKKKHAVKGNKTIKNNINKRVKTDLNYPEGT